MSHSIGKTDDFKSSKQNYYCPSDGNIDNCRETALCKATVFFF